MSRAGEKLYGDWQRWNDEYDRAERRRWRAMSRVLPIVATLLAALLVLARLG